MTSIAPRKAPLRLEEDLTPVAEIPKPMPKKTRAARKAVPTKAVTKKVKRPAVEPVEQESEAAPSQASPSVGRVQPQPSAPKLVEIEIAPQPRAIGSDSLIEMSVHQVRASDIRLTSYDESAEPAE